MSFIWIIISGIVINIMNVESQCQGKSYNKSEEANGHCFFEPPDDDYRIEINVEMGNVAPPEIFLFNMKNAKEVCNRYGAKVLQWDTTIPGKETDAIIELRKKLDGNVTIPVPCAGKGSDISDCYSGMNKTFTGFEAWYVLLQNGKTVQSLGGYYAEKARDGLICHHLSKVTSRQPEEIQTTTTGANGLKPYLLLVLLVIPVTVVLGF